MASRPDTRTPAEYVWRPLVLEVLGPAGAGKTTVLHALQQQYVLCDHLAVPWPDKFRVVGSIARDLLPAHLREHSRGRWFNFEELRRLAYVEAWRRVLARTPVGDAGMIVLDHGPLFMLGMVQEFGPGLVKSQQFARWSEAAIVAWSRTLDMVVWLDAPNDTLVQRIERRERDHIVKGKPLTQATIFLERCRQAFERILAAMADQGSPSITRFDTSRISPKEVVQQFVRVLCARTVVHDDQAAAAKAGY